jgi:hypothetical protein
MATSTPREATSADLTLQLSEDDLFDVLSNRRRRYVIEILEGRTQALELGTMATRIAARENSIEESAVSREERKRVYTALQQSHLPKMDAAGLVDFDKQQATITPMPPLDAAGGYLTETRQTETPWSGYYLGLTAASVGILVAVWGNLWPFALVSSLAWTVAIVTCFGCAAVVHWYHCEETA